MAIAEKFQFKLCPCVGTQPTSAFHIVGLGTTPGVSQETLALANRRDFLTAYSVLHAPAADCRGLAQHVHNSQLWPQVTVYLLTYFGELP
jgi:hypothetical protein